MKNFFGHLKSELLYLVDWNSVDEFISEIHEYIKYYDSNRIKLRLDFLRIFTFRKLSYS